MDRERAYRVLLELNRKLLLLEGNEDRGARQRIVESILKENPGGTFEEQGEEKQLRILLGLKE